MNPGLAHLIRSEGYSRQASLGVAFGGILNMVLDPLFIYGLSSADHRSGGCNTDFQRNRNDLFPGIYLENAWKSAC